MIMVVSDREIIEALCGNLNRGGQLLFTRYYKPLVFYADSLLDNRGYAEDLVQDVFFRFISRRVYAGIDHRSLSPYLFRAVRNSAIDLLRRHREIRLDPADLLRIQILEEEDTSFDPEVIDRIRNAIAGLPVQTGRVVKAIIVDRKKYRDIGEELNISLNTVKTLARNGMKTLRDLFAE